MSKKYTFPAIFLSFLLPFFFFFSVPLASAAERGDVDGSGEVEVDDARLALRQAVGLERYEETDPDAFYACDVDGNGEVEVDDARIILRIAVGLDPWVPDIITVSGEYTIPFSNSLLLRFVILRNNSDTPQKVTGSAIAKDNEGEVISIGEMPVREIGPGEEAASVFFLEDISEFASIEYDLHSAEDLSYLSCVSDLSYTQYTSENSIVVHLNNNTEDPISFIDVYALFFSEDNQLVDFYVSSLGQNGEILQGYGAYSFQLDTYKPFHHADVYLNGCYFSGESIQSSVSQIETQTCSSVNDENELHYYIRVKNNAETSVDYYYCLTALDASGTAVKAQCGWIPAIPSGEENVASVVFDNSGDLCNFELYQDAIATTNASKNSFLIVDLEKYETDHTIAITNTAEEEVQIDYGTILYLDENDQIINDESIFVFDPIAPGETIEVQSFWTGDFTRLELFFTTMD